jgi:hypothetical protein
MRDTIDMAREAAGGMLSYDAEDQWRLSEMEVMRLVELVRADEREVCADKTGEFARKWWLIHCDSNKHMETTRKAHDDFCALQAAIRARGETK